MSATGQPSRSPRRPKRARKPFLPPALARWWSQRKPWTKRVLIGVGALFGLGFLGLVLLVTVASRIPVPGADERLNAQTTIVQWSDRSEMGRLVGSENRQEVPLKDVPEHVQDAVIAAEDRGFYKHSGVSIRGIVRAAYRDLRGGGVRQGGSTIPQQYAKNAFDDKEKTFARKFREAVIAVKLDRKYTKKELLELYLNEIYFGRGAYGIEAASRTYYGKSAKALTPEQGAFLAGIIASPESFDPDTDRGRAPAERRFRYVLDGMADMGNYDPAAVETAEFPMPTRPRGATIRIKGPRSYILDAVRAEVRRVLEVDDEAIYTDGFRIRTTIDRKAQQSAEQAISEFFPTQPAGLQQALVAVDPKTGAIRAMYAGREPEGNRKRVDYSGIVGTAKRQPGSSFKPYVLAAALENDMGLKSVYDGNSPSPPYPDKPEGFDNFGGADYGQVDLLRATAKSVNTTYVKLGQDVGIEKVADAAHRAGIRREIEFDSTAASTPLGVVDVAVVDQAVGFATFANGGERVTPYLVGNVFTAGGKRLYEVKPRKNRAFDERVAADVTFALQGVIKPDGTAGGAALEGGRPAAGKTGTTTNNRDTWFVGFTPQLSTAVWIGFDPPKELRNVEIGGQRVTALTGGRGPALIWKRFMDAALEGADVVPFPEPAFVGRQPTLAPSPTVSPTLTPSATATQGATTAPTSAPPVNSSSATEPPPTQPPPAEPPPTVPPPAQTPGAFAPAQSVPPAPAP